MEEPVEALVAWLPAAEVELDAESASVVSLPEGPHLMVLAHGSRGCHFLGADDRCGVYDARPRDCELYPFVLERDERRRPVRLSLFEPDGCGDRAATRASLDALEQADRTRWAELSAYRERVARWNRAAWHRKRLGHRARTASEFLAFALEDTGARPPVVK